MTQQLLVRMHELQAVGVAFAVATVVRAERPTSARPGAKAIVHADGTLEGWIGGSCAQPLVAEEAKKALADGQPRLLHLSPKVMGEWAAREGVVSLEMTCFSGGTLEIFIEPVLPRPHLALVGASPVIETLARLGSALNYGITVIDPNATLEQFPGAEVLTTLDLRQASLRGHSYVVIASHGYYDEDAVQQALLSDAHYVALVASPKRTAAVIEYLREQGVAEDRLGRLKGPAGLDLGAQTPDEIAVSILAEMVKVGRETGRGATTETRQEDRGVVREGDRETGSQGALGTGIEITFQERLRPLAEVETAIDPICGMTVEKATARHTTIIDGETYYFCCPGCKRQFEKQRS